MVHGDVITGSTGDRGSQYLPIHEEDLEQSGMDYAALGHIHAPGVFRVGRVTVVYPVALNRLTSAIRESAGFTRLRAEVRFNPVRADGPSPGAQPRSDITGPTRLSAFETSRPARRAPVSRIYGLSG